MKKIVFYDAKSYDIESFNRVNKNYEIIYLESKLNEKTVVLAKGADAVCAFVNDKITKKVIDDLNKLNVGLLLMRCAGYNNIDIDAAFGKVHIVRVPAYSPNAVAEHAVALLLTLDRKIHKAYIRTKDFNFNIQNLTGFNIYQKTVGVIGAGRIGQAFINIMKGFGARVIAYNPIHDTSLGIDYVDLDTLFKESDIISLHCPLTNETKHMINKDTINLMKEGVVIINTSRGALINTQDLLEGLKSKKIRAAGLDVYEEEANLFFEDNSNNIITDDTLSLLINMPNVILTSHQAYLTEEALHEIAAVTLKNADAYFNNEPLLNEVCYHCKDNPGECFKKRNKSCF